MEKELKSISSNNDWDFYYNTQNIRNQSFVLETEQYFESGARKGFLEPLVFMNLFWEQLQYFINNAHKPYSTLQHFEALPLTAEQRHVLYCFILKFYGGYPLPVSNIDGIQLQTTLLLLSEAFLRYEGNTLEKEYCQNINQPKNLNDKLISLEPLPESYQYTAKDFEGFATNNDWDFYHNLENTMEQQHLVFPIKKYFQAGERAGFIEPLAFMNLFWKQREIFFQSQNSVRSFTDNLKTMPINEEVRHILYGWFLKFVGGYHYQPKGVWYDVIFFKIEYAFESYEGKTPEKRFCLREEEREKKISEVKAILDAEVDRESLESTKHLPLQVKEPELKAFEQVFVFRNEVITQIINILKVYFKEDAEKSELERILNNGNNADRKLFFLSNGNRLANLFKQLYEYEFIVGCDKKGLEKWIIDNFNYKHRGEIKSFTPDYIEKCISRDYYSCENPLIKIINKEIKIVEKPTKRKQRKY
ncbi:hypothetical protein DR864_05465 [Runella rosea]|uniref:Uncharacterized protein n=1 Tax=Runella rosea TaxID=2259595 RepID=A0A344TEZ9_9BACT|nr:hypothetical protein [Runella rosea]AXE17220.1 hypothetical protein DR864_05465 [Runella rosea]